MSKMPTRVTASGTTLSGASLKALVLALIDALNSAGFQETSRTTVTTTSTLTITQCGLVMVDCTAGNVVLTLPNSGAAADDALYLFRRVDATTNTLTVQRGSTDTVEGATTGLTVAASGVLELQLPAGSGNWRVLFIGGASVAATRAALSAAGVIRKQSFTATGTYTPDPDLLYCIVEMVGGGAGGGGSNATVAAGGGGGAGGYSRAIFTKATIGASRAVTIGAAGSGGSGDATGGAGGTTSLGVLMTATGGSGGRFAQNGGGDNLGTGGAGGVGTGGDLNTTGGGGSSGAIISGATFGIGGAGGTSALGGGGQSGYAGNAATGYGGGGSGVGADISAIVNGGAGKAGLVFITEFCAK
jgi:hypothetical protein